MYRRYINSWVPPPPGWIKINFDVVSGATFWAVGVVARDSVGELVLVFSDLIPKDDPELPIDDSTVVGEALAAKAAIECGKSMEDKDFIVLEGDAREVIYGINTAMNDNRYDPGMAGMVDEKIIETARVVAKSLDKCIGGAVRLVFPEANAWAYRVARWAAITNNTGFVPPHRLQEMARRLRRDNLSGFPGYLV